MRMHCWSVSTSILDPALCCRWPGWAPPEPADGAAERRLLLFARTAAALAPALPGLRVALADVADARAGEALFLRAIAAAQASEQFTAPQMGAGGAGLASGEAGPDAVGVASGSPPGGAHVAGERGAERGLPALAALHQVLAEVWRDGHALCAADSGTAPGTLRGAQAPSGAAHAAGSQAGAAEHGPARGPAASRSAPDTPAAAQGTLTAAVQGPEGALNHATGPATPAALQAGGAAAEGWESNGQLELDPGESKALDPGPEHGDQEGWGDEEELNLDLAGAEALDPVAGPPAPIVFPAAPRDAAAGRRGDASAEQRGPGAPAESTGYRAASPPGPAGEGWDSEDLDVGAPGDPETLAPAPPGAPAPGSGWGSGDEEVASMLGATPAGNGSSRAPTSHPAPDQPPADGLFRQAPTPDAARVQTPALGESLQAATHDPQAGGPCGDGGAPVPLHTCWAALLQAMLRAGQPGAERVHAAASGPAAALREADAARAAGRLLVTDAEARALVDAARLQGARHVFRLHQMWHDLCMQDGTTSACLCPVVNCMRCSVCHCMEQRAVCCIVFPDLVHTPWYLFHICEAGILCCLMFKQHYSGQPVNETWWTVLHWCCSVCGFAWY